VLKSKGIESRARCDRIWHKTCIIREATTRWIVVAA